jgi:predicted nucleic acid-binding protein
MVIYVLDSSTILRYLDDEPGAARVAEITKSHLAGRHHVMMAAPHWDEVAGITWRAHGRDAMELVLSRLSAFGFAVVPADAERAVRASLIKLERHIPYVDAFGVQLAAEAHDRVFVTADFDLKAAIPDVKDRVFACEGLVCRRRPHHRHYKRYSDSEGHFHKAMHRDNPRRSSMHD